MQPFSVVRFNVLSVFVSLFLLVSSEKAIKTSQGLNENVVNKEQLSLEKLLTMFQGLEAKIHNQELEIRNANDQIIALQEQVQHLALMALFVDNSFIDNKSRNAKISVRKNIRSAVFYPRTCKEARDSGLPEFQESGMYWIDPDGLGIGDGAIYVYCDMSSGTTSVGHDSETTISIPKCTGPGCYSREIVYKNTTIKQIEALIDISEECQQSIQVNCIAGPFTIDKINYAWWNDVDGNEQYFWSGSDNSIHTCQCGIESPNSCIRPDLTCNCDANVAVSLSDNGVVTLKDVLPVTKLNFGETRYEGGSHTLGTLKCSGKSSTSNYPQSCQDLWRTGHFLNGFFPIQQEKKLEFVHCDFSLGQNVVETPVGYIDVKSQPVQFNVQTRNTNYTQSSPGVAVPFDTPQLNEGNHFDIATGIFTAPTPGTYTFEFSGVDLPGSEELVVGLNRNEELVGSFYAANHGATPIPSILHLNKGDTIKVVVTTPNGMLYADATRAHFTHFTGILLEEDIFE